MDANTEAVAGARVARELGAEVLRLPADLHATEEAAAAGARAAAQRARGRRLGHAHRHRPLRRARRRLRLRQRPHGGVDGRLRLERRGARARRRQAHAAGARAGGDLRRPADRGGGAERADARRHRRPARRRPPRGSTGWRRTCSTARTGASLQPLPELDVAALLAGDVEATRGAAARADRVGAGDGGGRQLASGERLRAPRLALLGPARRPRGLRPRALHGLQVGYATGFAMRLQRFAFGGGVALPRRRSRWPSRSTRRARAWLGEPPPDVLAAVAEKQRLIAAVPASWPDDRAALGRACARGWSPRWRRFDAVAEALRRAGIPDREPGYLGIDAAMLRAGLRYGGRLRARYTVVDFLEGQGVLEEALDGPCAARAATSVRGRARAAAGRRRRRRRRAAPRAAAPAPARRRSGAPARCCARRGSRC